MERNNLKNHHIITGRSMKEPINNKVKNTREYCTSYENQEGGDLLRGYLWNPRSYICSFCKREFKSAQALGGHMNVHRRERARLRQYSPPNSNPNPLFNLNLNPNPNANLDENSNSSFLSQSPFPSTFSHVTTSLSPIEGKERMIKNLLSQYEGDQNLEKIKYSTSFYGDGNFEGYGVESVGGILKNVQVIWLDLEIGLISSENEATDLDLELRLGR